MAPAVAVALGMTAQRAQLDERTDDGNEDRDDGDDGDDGEERSHTEKVGRTDWRPIGAGTDLG
jgi:hypothetical protein